MMSRDVFEAEYAASSGVTVEQLHTYGRYAEPCDCGDGAYCRGWKMGRLSFEQQLRKAEQLLTGQEP
jgi:hypothetical protein